MSFKRHALFPSRRKGSGRRLRQTLFVVIAAASTAALAEGDIRQATELLSEVSLEDLLETQLTTASRRVERIADSAASVTVITADDIARAASSHIEDLFRTVPGMQVGRINNSHWAISTRGANSLFSSNLLVMVDGRTIYSPVFSGVWWDTQEIPLEEIARIEIIRGPGASLWGVNAVNGVINIITKDAANTKGGLVSAGTGSVDRGNLYARYGMQYGENGYLRVFARRTSMDDTPLSNGSSGRDENMAERAGFRLDQSFGDDRKLTMTGETYRLESNGGPIPVPTTTPMVHDQFVTGYPQRGFHALARYSMPVASGQLTMQGFYIHEMLTGTSIGMNYWRHTWDFDFQHSVDIDNHRLVWGGGARRNKLEMVNSHYIGFNPTRVEDRLTNLFVQDEISLMDNRLRVTLGSKFEHNSDSGLQVQPTLRALYALGEQSSVWGAFSRAARTPFWGQQYVEIHQEWRPPGCVPLVPTLPCNVIVRGNPESRAEKINTFEMGYRTRPTEKTSLDVSTFFSHGHGIMSLEIDPQKVALMPTHLDVPMYFGNLASRTNHGVEGSLEWQAMQGFRLRVGSAWYWEHFDTRASLVPEDVQNTYYDETFGRWNAFVRGSHDWSKLSLDWTVRHLTKPPRYGKAYTVLDFRLGWQAAKDLELSLAATGLGGGKREEFGVQWFVAPTQTVPEWSLRAKWYF